MNAVATKLKQNIVDGLDRKTLRVPAIWAEKCRVMGEPFPGSYSFKWTPWCREMMNTQFPDCVGQKSAQAGFTETLLNIALFTIDQQRRSVLYVLPNTKPDASDFTQARFNPALELSPHLASMFSATDNMGLKRAGSASLYIRGSRSRSQLKSIPVAKVLADEVDEMDQEAIFLLNERMSGQPNKQFWKTSTPSIPGYGINLHYENSTQEHYMFKCPHCSRTTELLFPDCMVITAEDERDPNVRNSYIKCKECNKKITQDEKLETLQKGFWHPTYENRNIRGFWVNQLYSYTVQPWEFALSYLRGHSSKEAEQEFYNSKLGTTHIAEGANISIGDIEKCIGNYRNVQKPTDGMITIGIDVGKQLHFQVRHWKNRKGINTPDVNDRAHARVIHFGTIDHWTHGLPELDPLIRAYKPQCAVIDAMPETKSSLAFCQRFKGLVYMCYYSPGAKSRDISIREAESTVSVNRTMWLDANLNRFREGTITIPADTDHEFKEHNCAPIRVFKKDQTGHDVSHYVNTRPDHYAHAGTYAEIALKVAMNRSGGSTTVGTPLGR